MLIFGPIDDLIGNRGNEGIDISIMQYDSGVISVGFADGVDIFDIFFHLLFDGWFFACADYVH